MKYTVGQRWYCDRGTDNPYKRPNFTLIIMGKGDRPGTKRCRIEVDGWQGMTDTEQNRNAHGSEQDYSHKHLQKYMTLVTES